MIGILCGVKNNKLIGFIKIITLVLIKGSIILEGGNNSAEKIIFIKISKNLEEPFRNKLKYKKQHCKLIL